MADPYALPEGSTFTPLENPYALPQGSTFGAKKPEQPEQIEQREMSLLDKAGFAASQALGITPITNVKKSAAKAVEMVAGNNEFNLPAIQETEEYRNVSVLDQAKGIFSSGESVDKTFLEANPDVYEGEPDKAGNRMVYKEGKPFAYFEQPGIGKTDVVEGITNVAAMALPAAKIAQMAQHAGRFGRAVVGGVAESATQFVIEMFDLDEGVDWWNVGLAATMPAAAESLGAVFKQVNKRQRKEFTEIGKKYAAQKEGMPTDLSDESYLTMGMRESGKLEHKVTDDAIIAIEEFKVPMTAGQATGDATQLGREQALREKGFKEIIGTDAAQRDALQRNVIEPRFKAAKGERSESETGAELIETLQQSKKSAKADAKEFQTARDTAIEQAGKVDADMLTPIQSKLSSTIDDFRVLNKRNKKAVPVSRQFMPGLMSDIKDVIARGKDRVIRPEIPGKPKVTEGNVQRAIDTEMKYMRVKEGDATYVRIRLDEMRDATDYKRRQLRFELENKGYRASDISRAEKNIVGVRRAAPSVPKTPAEKVKGEQVHMDELTRINEDINSNLRSAKGKDRAALVRLKSDFEEYMVEDLTTIFRDNPDALAAVSSITEANASWRVYKDAFSKAHPSDRIGHILDNIKNMDAEKIVDTIVGGGNLKLTGKEMNRLMDSAGLSKKFGTANAAKTKDLILEAVERRVWGDAKRSLAEKTPDQAFNMLRQLLHGNRKELGAVLYSGTKRNDAEKVLKLLDTIRRAPSTKAKLEIFNSAYARMNLGAMRTVMGVDQAIGYPWRKMMARSAVKPLALKKGEFAGKTYVQASAIYEAAGGDE